VPISVSLLDFPQRRGCRRLTARGAQKQHFEPEGSISIRLDAEPVSQVTITVTNALNSRLLHDENLSKRWPETRGESE
jgi:hypothetical protein